MGFFRRWFSPKILVAGSQVLFGRKTFPLTGGRATQATTDFTKSPPYRWILSLFYGKKAHGVKRVKATYESKGPKCIRPKPKRVKLMARGGRVYRCYCCKDQPIYITLPGIIDHNRIHPMNPHLCPKCMSTFPNEEWFNTHVKSKECDELKGWGSSK